MGDAWPILKDKRQLVRVITEDQTDTHIMTYREDGILSIYVDDALLADLEMIPEFVEVSRHTVGCVYLNRAGRKVLRRILNRIDRYERQTLREMGAVLPPL